MSSLPRLGSFDRSIIESESNFGTHKGSKKIHEPKGSGKKNKYELGSPIDQELKTSREAIKVGSTLIGFGTNFERIHERNGLYNSTQHTDFWTNKPLKKIKRKNNSQSIIEKMNANPGSEAIKGGIMGNSQESIEHDENLNELKNEKIILKDFAYFLRKLGSEVPPAEPHKSGTFYYEAWKSFEKNRLIKKKTQQGHVSEMIERDKLQSLQNLQGNRNFSNLSNLVLRNFEEPQFLYQLKRFNLRQEQLPHYMQSEYRSNQEKFILNNSSSGVKLTPNDQGTKASMIELEENEKEGQQFSSSVKGLKEQVFHNLKYSEERNELLDIAKRLEKLAQILEVQKDMGSEEKVEMMQAAFSENMEIMIFHVSKEFPERGNLIANIWDSNLELLQAYIKRVISQKDKTESSLKEEIKYFREESSIALKALNGNVESIKATLLNKEEENINLMRKLKAYKKCLATTKKNLKKARKTTKVLELNYHRVLKELIQMKFTYEKLNHYEVNNLKDAFNELESTLKAKEASNEIESEESSISDEDESFLDLENEKNVPDVKDPLEKFGLLGTVDEKENTGGQKRGPRGSIFAFQNREVQFSRNAMTETDDLLLKSHKETMATTKEISSDKQIQYDIADIIDLVHDFEIHNNYDGLKIAIPSAFRNLDYPEDSAIIITSDSSPMNKNKRSLRLSVNTNSLLTPNMTPEGEKSSESATLRKKFSFGLKKRMEEGSSPGESHMYALTIGSLCETFSEEMTKLYENLDSVYELFTESSDKMNFYNMLRAHKEESFQFLKIVYLRDKDRQNRILQAKIDVSEKNLEMDEKITTITSWEQRFSKLVKKYDEIKMKYMELQRSFEESQSKLFSTTKNVVTPAKQVEIKSGRNVLPEDLNEFPKSFPLEDSPKTRKSGVFDDLRLKFEKKELDNMINAALRRPDLENLAASKPEENNRKSLIILQDVSVSSPITNAIKNSKASTNSNPGSMAEIVEEEDEGKHPNETQEDENSTPGDEEKMKFKGRRIPRSESSKGERLSFLSIKNETQPILQIPIPNSPDKKSLRRSSMAPPDSGSSLSIFSPPVKTKLMVKAKDDQVFSDNANDQSESFEKQPLIPSSATVKSKDLSRNNVPILIALPSQVDKKKIKAKNQVAEVKKIDRKNTLTVSTTDLTQSKGRSKNQGPEEIERSPARKKSRIPTEPENFEDRLNNQNNASFLGEGMTASTGVLGVPVPISALRKQSTSSFASQNIARKQGLKVVDETLEDIFTAMRPAEIENEIKQGQRYTLLSLVDKLFKKKKIIVGLSGPESGHAINFYSKLKEILKPKDDISVSSALKVISALYTEILKLRDKQDYRNPLSIYLYEYMLIRFGGRRSTAEEKITNLLRTCLAYKEMPKIRLFMKFIGIITDEPYEYDRLDFEFYLNTLVKLDDPNISSTPGAGLTMNSHENTYSPLEKTLSHVQKSLIPYSNLIRVESVLNSIKNEKFKDDMLGGRWFAPLDLAVELMINTKFDYYEKKYRNLFDALDFEREGLLSEEQYIIAFKVIYKNQYSSKKLKRNFRKDADLYDEDKEKKFMTFRRFAEKNEESEYFAYETTEKFKTNVFDDYKNLYKLEKDWEIKLNYIKLKLIKTNYYNKFYSKMVHTIEDYFNQKEKTKSNPEIIWMRYRICDQDSADKILETETLNLVPSLLDIINRVAKYLLD